MRKIQHINYRLNLALGEFVRLFLMHQRYLHVHPKGIQGCKHDVLKAQFLWHRQLQKTQQFGASFTDSLHSINTLPALKRGFIRRLHVSVMAS